MYSLSNSGTTVAAVLLENKLRQYIIEFEKLAEDAKVTLSTYKVFDPKNYVNASGALQESAAVLHKLVSGIRSVIDSDILELPEKVLNSSRDLIKVIISANNALVQAEILETKIQTRITHFYEFKDDVKFVSEQNELKSIKHVNVSCSGSSLSKNEPSDVVDSAKNTEVRAENITARSEAENGSAIECEKNAIPNITTKSQININVAKTITSQSLSTISKCKANQYVRSRRQPRREFRLRKFLGADGEFAQFWKEFRVTVDSSPIEPQVKFAALRSLIRGEPYRLFLDLNYRSAVDYQEALKLLFDKYASDEMKQASEPENSIRTISFPECDPADVRRAKGWSDEYFVNQYCTSVPNYEKPDRDLLIRTIHAFLNLYVLGPRKTPTENIKYIWIILLHGVKFDGKYLVDLADRPIFGKEEVPFPNIVSRQQEKLIKYAPHFLKKKENHESTPKLWEWKYSTVEAGTNIVETITTEKVRYWYNTCWEAVTATTEENKFQDYVKYFALLSMILFRVVVKQPEAVEKYVAVTFTKIFRGFCKTQFMPNGVPPHAGVYRHIRKIIFKKQGENFKTYLTYLVGCYAFCKGDVRNDVRGFLNAGCLQQFACVGTGAIHWLRESAHRRQRKPEELLMYFTIDPSMEEKVKEMHEFMQVYKTEVTWRWARLFESKKLGEISTAACPTFAYACFLIGAYAHEIHKGREYAQFSRFLKNEDPSLTGENLGIMLRNLVTEWNTTPLSQVTKYLHKKYELQKYNISAYFVRVERKDLSITLKL